MRASDVRAGPQVCVQSNKVRHGVSEIGFEDCTRASSLHRGRATLSPCTPLWLPRYRAVAIRTRTVPSPELFLGLLPGDLAPLQRHVRPPPRAPNPPLLLSSTCVFVKGVGGSTIRWTQIPTILVSDNSATLVGGRLSTILVPGKICASGYPRKLSTILVPAKIWRFFENTY